MKKQLLKQALSLGMAAALLVGCSGGTTGGGDTGSDSGNQEQQTDGGSTGDVKVGVSMPTKDLQRWNQDGANMQEQLEAAGYTVDLQYASNDVQQQLSQVENMINNQVDVLVIAAIEGSSLGEALDMAKSAGIPVIAYDRLLMNSDAVSYYATFDNYMVLLKNGRKQSMKLI